MLIPRVFTSIFPARILGQAKGKPTPKCSITELSTLILMATIEPAVLDMAFVSRLFTSLFFVVSMAQSSKKCRRQHSWPPQRSPSQSLTTIHHRRGQSTLDTSGADTCNCDGHNRGAPCLKRVADTNFHDLLGKSLLCSVFDKVSTISTFSVAGTFHDFLGSRCWILSLAKYPRSRRSPSKFAG